MAIGFSNVFYVAAGVYVVGLLFMTTSADRREKSLDGAAALSEQRG